MAYPSAPLASTRRRMAGNGSYLNSFGEPWQGSKIGHTGRRIGFDEGSRIDAWRASQGQPIGSGGIAREGPKPTGRRAAELEQEEAYYEAMAEARRRGYERAGLGGGTAAPTPGVAAGPAAAPAPAAAPELTPPPMAESQQRQAVAQRQQQDYDNQVGAQAHYDRTHGVRQRGSDGSVEFESGATITPNRGAAWSGPGALHTPELRSKYGTGHAVIGGQPAPDKDRRIGGQSSKEVFREAAMRQGVANRYFNADGTPRMA